MDFLTSVLEKTVSPDKKEVDKVQSCLKLAAEINLPEFLKFLSDVFQHAHSSPVAQMAAGLELKNALTSEDQTARIKIQERWLKISLDTRNYIKQNVLNALGTERIRPLLTAQCVASIAAAELPRGEWPDLIQLLIQNVISAVSTETTKEATLEAIGYICQNIEPDVLVSHSNDILTAIVHGVRKDEPSNYVKLAGTNALLNSLAFIKANFEKESERLRKMTVACEATHSPEIKPNPPNVTITQKGPPTQHSEGIRPTRSLSPVPRRPRMSRNQPANPSSPVSTPPTTSVLTLLNMTLSSLPFSHNAPQHQTCPPVSNIASQSQSTMNLQNVVNEPNILRGNLQNIGLRMSNTSPGPVPSTGSNSLAVQLGQHQSFAQASQSVSQQFLNMANAMPSTISSKLPTSVNQMVSPHKQTMTTTSGNNIPMQQQSVPGLSLNMGQAVNQQQGQPQQQGQQTVGAKDRVAIWQGILEFHEEAIPSNQPQAQQVVYSLPCTFSSLVTDGDPDVNADKWPNKLCLQFIPKNCKIAKLFTIMKTATRHVLIHFNQELEDLSKLKTMSSGLVGCIQFPQTCDIRIMVILYLPDKKTYMGFIANDQESFLNYIQQLYENHRKQQQKQWSQQRRFYEHTDMMQRHQEISLRFLERKALRIIERSAFSFCPDTAPSITATATVTPVTTSQPTAHLMHTSLLVPPANPSQSVSSAAEADGIAMQAKALVSGTNNELGHIHQHHYRHPTPPQVHIFSVSPVIGFSVPPPSGLNPDVGVSHSTDMHPSTVDGIIKDQSSVPVNVVADTNSFEIITAKFKKESRGLFKILQLEATESTFKIQDPFKATESPDTTTVKQDMQPAGPSHSCSNSTKISNLILSKLVPPSLLMPGCIKLILSGENVSGPIIQTMGSRGLFLGLIEETSYKIEIADGSTLYTYAITDPQLSFQKTQKLAEKFTVIRLDDYSVDKIDGYPQIIKIIDFSVLISGADVGNVIYVNK